MGKNRDKKYTGSLTGGLIMIGIGLVFLLSNLGVIPDLDETWPLFLIIVGVSLLIGALKHRRIQEADTMPPSSESTPPTPVS